MSTGREASFYHATDILNKLLNRKEGSLLNSRTVSDVIERTGKKLNFEWDDFMNEAFVKSGITFTKDNKCIFMDGLPQLPPISLLEPDEQNKEYNEIMELINQYNSNKPIEQQIKDDKLIKDVINQSCIKILINAEADEIGVPHQKDKRSKGEDDPGVKYSKTVQTAVAVIAVGIKKYIVVADNVRQLLRRVLALLLHNNLLSDGNLVFFIDGANNLRKEIDNIFSIFNPTIYLDWYHLKHKCYEFLTMILVGGKANLERNESIRSEAYSILWNGNTEDCIDYLNNIPKNYIKDEKKLQDLIQYLLRKKDLIPCYSLRKLCSLKNSSAFCEKANDLVVGHRMKGQGMSWSYYGCHSLAQVNALYLNREQYMWINGHTLDFDFLSSERAFPCAGTEYAVAA